ncbi:MAG TPA: substrate-binding domain-containing protein [Anaerolineales bacterium]|nr:substrate-binding domain-containing protein [Anaerolineales bacterium]
MRLRTPGMRAMAVQAFAILAVGASCSPAGSGGLTPLMVYSTSAARPWVAKAYDCSPAGTALVLAGAGDADIIIRLTEPKPLAVPAFQIGEDDLLVVTHPQVAVGALSVAQVQSIFAGEVENWSDLGGADQPVQVWSFAPSVDIQWYFDRMVLGGRPVSSWARLAVSAQHMSDAVGEIPGSIGLLPRRWKAGNTREVLRISSVPVLALTPKPPGRAAAELIACMQATP